MAPDCSRASFNNLTKEMTATTFYCNPLGKTLGDYILAFNDPHPAFYVGVAEGGGKVPEGITNRILKHLVKVTGSHIGTGKYKTGGVNHTKHWRDYEVLRAQFYSNKQVPDQFSDARLIIGKLVSPVPHLTKT